MEAERAEQMQREGAVPTANVMPQRWYWWLLGISLGGSLDIVQFLAINRGMFTSAPGRAAGSVLGLVIWVALTSLAGMAASGRRSPRLARAILVLSILVAVGSVGLAAVHAAAHVGGLRPALGGVLGLAALSVAIVALRD